MLSGITETVARRHASPWSVWTRLLTTPLAYLPVWNRSWTQGLAVGAWFAINPILFPEPKDPDGWHARAIRGEFRWLKARPWDAAVAVQALGSLAGIAGAYAARKRRLAPVALSAVAVMACNVWFLNRMAETYGVEPESRRGGGS